MVKVSNAIRNKFPSTGALNSHSSMNSLSSRSALNHPNSFYTDEISKQAQSISLKSSSPLNMLKKQVIN